MEPLRCKGFQDQPVRRFLQWIVRHALLFVALVLAFGAAVYFGHDWNQTDEDRAADFQGLSEIEDQLRDGQEEWEEAFRESTDGLENRDIPYLHKRIEETTQQIGELEKRLREDKDKGVVERYREGAQGLVAYQKRKLLVARLRHELRTLQAARDLVIGDKAEPEARAALAKAVRDCDRATEDLEELKSEKLYSLRRWLQRDKHKRLESAKAITCRSRKEADERLKKIVAARASVEAARVNYEASKDDLDGTFDDALADLSSEREMAGTPLVKLRLFVFKHGLLWRALLALIGIIAMPYLIRLLFWFVFAPLAKRTSAIRLAVPGGRSATIPAAERSTTAVSIRLAAAEELLVRQSYLQTTSQGGTKATRWLLDWRHPLASIASGMKFLTRIRGAGETTTVSAVEDPLAEVTVLTLPDGSSCVLQPRALAAVVQPVDRPLLVKSHWRLGSVNAWLTLQFRYLVFHGPCRLVIKGGRGVRVERAEQGRIFRQPQLIGFSTDLAYSVTRAETFAPYFLGREQLFKDRVEAGAGILIIEEAPMVGRGKAGARRSLEGAFEVVTKAFGI